MIELTDKVIGLKYKILNPILELLLETGNEVFTDYTWSANPTGYLCILKKPIDFDLIESRFVLPKSIHFNKRCGEVDYGLGTVIICCA
ncbi:hypothetical protein LL295_19925 [Vibrio campbellii]|uniref:hypothetical protein n=1 Tax=Vibrio campbellii TaxID=680 RepID=UPI000D4BA8C4|nr:hypothetical protein [Vibrio campbellii]MCC4225764.1 hypothetical protein [Vibrio campbellii]PQJ44320.1 hypothetical protein BTN99_15520 [Vibrio campbellii]